MGSRKSFYAYTHSRPDGTVFYVGKGTARRAWNFTKGRNPHHRSIIEKHGAENIIVTIHPCESEEAAFELEVKLISEHQSLCNQTTGGEGSSGRPISDKVRAAFDAARGLPKAGKARAACSEALKKSWVENPAMRENAARMAEQRKGVKRPPHVVAALVAAHKGRKYSGERLEQIRAAQQVAKEAAKVWHSSTEGKVWHEQHGKKTWENREWVPCICQECGRTFGSPFPTRARYCELRCSRRAYRRKQGKTVGVRPNRSTPSLLSGKRAVGK